MSLRVERAAPPTQCWSTVLTQVLDIDYPIVVVLVNYVSITYKFNAAHFINENLFLIPLILINELLMKVQLRLAEAVVLITSRVWVSY